MTGPDVAAGRLLVRFPTHPHSVRTARQLVTDTLRARELDALVDDARLVVTELSTNATLHSGERSFQLSVTTSAGVRIAVGDDGAVPPAAIVRRARAGGPAPAQLRLATTGRGLAIVDELASAWGIDVDGPTTWVWAELGPAGAAASRGSRSTAPAAAEAPPLPPGWHVVRLLDCPVGLGLASDDHLDELVRELQLVGPRTDEPELASVIRGLLDGQAQARHMGRRTAQDAAARGQEVVTVEMVLPSRAADDVEQLDRAVAAADALCERERLLTLASAPEVRTLRTWMRDELCEQIRSGRAARAFHPGHTGAGPAGGGRGAT